MIRGNRGEWSEVYVLFRLLGDGAVQLVDETLLDKPGAKFKVDRVVRHEKDGDVAFRSDQHGVVIELDSDCVPIPSEEFVTAADQLLQNLLSADGQLEDEQAESLLHRLGINKLRASSKRKGDIGLGVFDPYLGSLQEIEMSIKSQLGSPATLFNAAGNATNFRYVARGFRGAVDQLPNKDSEKKQPRKFVSFLKSESSAVEFMGTRNKQFESNLRMIDVEMPAIIGAMLAIYFGSSISSIKSITDELVNQDPLEFGSELASVLYPHKVKCFLVDCALGLKTSQPWNGSYAANGGYVVVRPDGALACIHAFDRNTFQEYLYLSTRFDGPSSTRHNYGYVVEASQNSDGTYDVIFDLNLQVRFK